MPCPAPNSWLVHDTVVSISLFTYLKWERERVLKILRGQHRKDSFGNILWSWPFLILMNVYIHILIILTTFRQDGFHNIMTLCPCEIKIIKYNVSDRMIASEHLSGVPLLVLANKQDIPDCMGVHTVKPIFNQNAHLIGARDIMLMATSALNGYLNLFYWI